MAPGDQDGSVVAVPVAATVPSCYSFSVAAVVQRSLDFGASVWWLSRRQKRSLVALPQCGGCRSPVALPQTEAKQHSCRVRHF